MFETWFIECVFMCLTWIIVVKDLQRKLLSRHDLDGEVSHKVPLGVDGVVDFLGLGRSGSDGEHGVGVGLAHAQDAHVRLHQLRGAVQADTEDAGRV